MNEYEFFHRAALWICWNLEIEEVMYSLHQFLSEFMPVDALVFEHFDYDYNAMRLIALKV